MGFRFYFERQKSKLWHDCHYNSKTFIIYTLCVGFCDSNFPYFTLTAILRGKYLITPFTGMEPELKITSQVVGSRCGRSRSRCCSVPEHQDRPPRPRWKSSSRVNSIFFSWNLFVISFPLRTLGQRPDSIALLTSQHRNITGLSMALYGVLHCTSLIQISSSFPKHGASSGIICNNILCLFF